MTYVLGNTAPVTVAKGTSANVSYSLNLGVGTVPDGSYQITAIADPNNTVAESNENNNQLSRTVTVRGNQVSNGSFENSANGTTPDGWTGGKATAYDTSGSNSSDGTKSVSITGNGGPSTLLNSAWTSAPFDVVPGQTYNLAMTVKTQGLSSSPSLQVNYLDATGKVLSTVNGLTTKLTGTAAATEVLGKLTVPAGVSKIELVLTGFSLTDLTTKGTVWFDNVWVW